MRVVVFNLVDGLQHDITGIGAVDDDIAEDETPGEFKLVWNERYGGFINDSRYGFDAALTGKMGNYIGPYYAANSVLFKQK